MPSHSISIHVQSTHVCMQSYSHGATPSDSKENFIFDTSCQRTSLKKKFNGVMVCIVGGQKQYLSDSVQKLLRDECSSALEMHQPFQRPGSMNGRTIKLSYVNMPGSSVQG
jgi:hypothetical protein